MILRPQGLIPNVRRSRELHDEERDTGRVVEGSRHEAEGSRPEHSRHGSGQRETCSRSGV